MVSILIQMATFGSVHQAESMCSSEYFSGILTFLNAPQKIMLFVVDCQFIALTLCVLSKHGELLGGERFTTIATSNLLLAPDGYIYVTGNHGVYRKKVGKPLKDEL